LPFQDELQDLLLKRISQRKKVVVKAGKGFDGRCIKKGGLANGTCISVLSPVLCYV
jgi:hypothetical protein